MTEVRRPPGWPRDLPPAGTDEFNDRVSGWLLDHCHPEVRASETLRSQPTVLAVLALRHTTASLDALRTVYRQARATFLLDVEPKQASAIVAALEAQGAKLAAEQREVMLVARVFGIEAD